jgi:CDP-diacylglycerol--serine O-phosphatidyltransferase
MTSSITRHIPNAVTCCNLFSGCIACVMAFEMNYQWAVGFIILGAVFDFFDGMLARLLHVSGPMGKELDSLADDVTFGLAPAVMVFSLFKEMTMPDALAPIAFIVPYFAFLIAVFSVLRLAKFNIDTRQTSSFIGLPTPANALFWGSLLIGQHDFLISAHFNVYELMALVVLTSWMLVAEIPMFSLKFKNLAWKENRVKYLFLLVSVLLLLWLGIAGLAAVIVWYVLLSAFTQGKAKKA